MTAIKITNLTFAYEGTYENIFENVSFQLDSAWKLGFTGRNGRGKTTFLKILEGSLSYKGRIDTSVKFDYFPFTVNDQDRDCETIAYDLNPELQRWALVKEMGKLLLSEDILSRPYASLSEGERTKLLLAILFLRDNHFLLIDEPTNHLDLRGRDCVSRYLNEKEGFLLVSHDRAFLDGCIDHVLSIEKTSIDIQKGNFSSLLQNKAYQDQFELAENEKLLKDIDRLGKAAKRTAGWSQQLENSKYGNGPVDRGYIGHKSAKMMKRSKHIERRREQSLEEKKKLLKNLERVEALELRPLGSGGKTLLEVEALELSYGVNPLFAPLSFTLQSGERIAIAGGNGSGKSSLLHSLLDALSPCHLNLQTSKILRTKGHIRSLERLKISHVSQDTRNLFGSLEDFCKAHDIEEALLKSLLIKLDFKRSQFEKDIAEFSEGQKKKLLIARSICEQAHIYIWDEPLNYVDVLSRMQIEELIKTYKPTLIFVEHDSDFVNAIATKVVSLKSIV